MNVSRTLARRYRKIFFSEGSNGADKNEFYLNIPVLQPHFSVKYKRQK